MRKKDILESLRSHKYDTSIFIVNNDNLTLLQWLRYLKSTVTDVKRLLGKKHNEKDVEIESKRAAYKIVEQDGKLAVPVCTMGDSEGRVARGEDI